MRQYLLSQEFIASDDDNAKWRFLEPVVDEADRGRKDLRVISLQEEKRTHLDDLYQDLQACPELLLTNIAKGAEDQPDLMGFLVNGFKEGDLTVTCLLNDFDAKARQANKGKFNPIMLSNVMTTSESVHRSFPRVCICCKDSVIKFHFDCCGTLGFWYEVHLNDEKFTMVRSSGVRWEDGVENTFGSAECFSWDGGDGQIVIKDTAAAGISSDLELNYMKVTVRAVDLLSWKDHDNNAIVKPKTELGKRKLQAKLDGQLVNYCHPIASADNSAQLRAPLKRSFKITPSAMTFDSLQNDAAQKQTGIEGGDVSPATPTRGEGQDITYGHWWCWDTSSFEKAQETMDIFFFVFQDLETAQRYIGHFNEQSLKAGASVWRA